MNIRCSEYLFGLRPVDFRTIARGEGDQDFPAIVDPVGDFAAGQRVL